MPKKNQIPYFTEQVLADGTVAFHWKPSPRLRRAGWQNLKLGEGEHQRTAAKKKALDRNEAVATWEAERAGVAAPAPKRRRLRWRDLVGLYRESDRYTGLKPKSRAEYESRLRWLDSWAEAVGPGGMLLDDLTRQVAVDLRDQLVAGKSAYTAAAILRVLHVVCKFGGDRGLLPIGITSELRIPEPPKRKRRLLLAELAPLLASAEQLKLPHVALAITLGFYTLQREADLLGTTAFSIKPIEGISAAARGTLAGPDGKVMGLHLEQGKTGTHVAIALAPAARAGVESALAANKAAAERLGVTPTHLIPHPLRPSEACPDWKLQRDFRAVVGHAVERGDGYIEGIQFRDLRRSGMCWMRDLRVPIELIALNSGHSIDETKKILETYMPRDTRGAAEGMALAVAAQAERDAAEQLEREGQG